jgi:tetratricopeptide (TPR) repeat protein
LSGNEPATNPVVKEADLDWPVEEDLDTEEESSDEKVCVLDKGKPLSQSILWKLQRNFFEGQGIEAWRQGTVPHYVTSNPFIANAYARVVFGFIRDCTAVPGTSENESFPPLDPGQPIYIIELGSGSGRFAYHFLKKFLGFYPSSVLKDGPFKYVMTDCSERNVEFWREHRSLKPLVEEGALDFALFDGERDEELKLAESGGVLAPGTVKNPIVVIANYFFDSIPHDAFFIQGGQLQEGLVTVSSYQQEPDLHDPELLSRAKITYDRNPVETDYYENPDWNEILEYYQKRLDDTAFLLPCAALKCIETLSNLSDGRLLVISADKGYNREEDLLGRGEPKITIHGSFSMMVNYHAIGKYVQKQGGHPLHTANRHNRLNISTFLLGNHPGDYVETRQAYREAIETCGPDDFYALKKAIEHGYESWTLKQLLAYIRLSGFDAKIMLACYPALMDRIENAPESSKQELCHVIGQVWEVYYPIAENRDVACRLGVLLYELGSYAEALCYFNRSLEIYGADPTVTYNMSMCHYELGQMEKALEFINETLLLDPRSKHARAMRIRIEATRKKEDECNITMN